MKGLRSIRPLSRESLRGVEPAPLDGARPVFEWVDPRDIYVEESYQREIREKGVRLVRKVVAGWSWAKYTPPVCVRLKEWDEILVAIDGQHTATAAASHPGIKKIPVMIVGASALKDRGDAFVGKNRDRIGLTAPLLYRADLVRGDPIAQTVDRACRFAGAVVLEKNISLKNPTEVGATIAVGALKMIARDHGEEFLVRVLKVLVAAKRGPIKAGEISAVAVILAEHPAADARLRDVVASKTAEVWGAEAAAVSARTGEAGPSALAGLWAKALGTAVSRTVRSSGGTSARDLLRGIRPAAQAGREPPKPAPPPPLPPPAPKPAPAPPSGPAPPISRETATRLSRNGVVLDLEDGALTHRGKTVRLGRAEWRALVAALLGVMPSILDAKRLEAKVYPRALDAGILLRGLIAEVNPVLRAARLDVVMVGKVGHVLRDLGA
jgi:hypothetical protein